MAQQEEIQNISVPVTSMASGDKAEGGDADIAFPPDGDGRKEKGLAEIKLSRMAGCNPIVLSETVKPLMLVLPPRRLGGRIQWLLS